MTLKEYKRSWYLKNKERLNKKAKLYRENHKDEIKKYAQSISKEKRAQYRANSRENSLSCTRRWRSRNQEHLKSYARTYVAKRKKESVQFRIRIRLRKRICAALNRKPKSLSAVKDLGCTIVELKKYLESKFKPGMTWDNWSHKGWHIDHIIPLCSFDLTDPLQFLKAVHFSNLQPLWAHENLVKSGYHEES